MTKKDARREMVATRSQEREALGDFQEACLNGEGPFCRWPNEPLGRVG